MVVFWCGVFGISFEVEDFFKVIYKVCLSFFDW